MCCLHRAQNVTFAHAVKRKSQIAIEYAYRMRTNAPDTWVFWVYASSVAKIAEGYQAIAKAMRIPGWDKPNIDVFEIVYDWLCNEANGRWIMILDNVDDLDVLTAPSPHQAETNVTADQTAHPSSRLRQIREYLPNSNVGSILITSRARNVAFELTGNWNHCHQVEVMTEDEALALLKKKLAGTHEEDDMKELVTTLDCMPLAISQAAAYISRRHPLVTITTFIQDLKKENEDTNELLEESAHESHRDLDRSNSVVATWHISFQYVRRMRPSAASLLSLMCLFERQSIIRPLLEANYGPVDRFEKQVPPPTSWWNYAIKMLMGLLISYAADDEEKKSELPALDFTEDWTVLNDLSLIKTMFDGKVLSMHRLVQLATLRWLEAHNERDAWSTRFISVMKMFPETGTRISANMKNHGDPYLLDALYPHVRRAVHYRPDGPEVVLRWAPLMYKAACHAECQKFFDDALLFSRLALEVFEEWLGPEHEVSVRSAAVLAETLYGLRKYEEAEPMLRKTLKARIKLSGELDVVSISLTKLLSKTMWHQGKGSESLALEKKALEREIESGDVILGSPATVERLHHAIKYAEIGDYQQAEEIFRSLYDSIPGRVEEWTEHTAGETGVLITLAMDQRRWEMAESLLRRLLLVKTNTPEDSQHYTRFRDKLQLGQALAEQGKFDEANRLCSEVYSASLKIREKGGTGEWFGEAIEFKASLLMKQGDLVQAEKICRHMVLFKMKSDGALHANTLGAWSLLGEILETQQRYGEALECYQLAYYVSARDKGRWGYLIDPYPKKYKRAYENLKKKIDSGSSPSLVEEIGVGTNNEISGASSQETGNDYKRFWQVSL